MMETPPFRLAPPSFKPLPSHFGKEPPVSPSSTRTAASHCPMKTICSVCDTCWPFAQHENCEKNVLNLVRSLRLQSETPGLHVHLARFAASCVPLVPSQKLTRLAFVVDGKKDVLVSANSFIHVHVSSVLPGFQFCNRSKRFLWWSHDDGLMYTLLWCTRCQSRGVHSIVGIDMTASTAKRISLVDTSLLLCPAVAAPCTNPFDEVRPSTPRRDNDCIRALRSPLHPLHYSFMRPASAVTPVLHKGLSPTHVKQLRVDPPSTPLRLYEYS